MTKITEDTRFDIRAYQGTSSVTFGMNPSEVNESLGPPEQRSLNHQGKPVEFRAHMNVSYTTDSVRAVDHIGFGRQMRNVFLGDINIFELPSAEVLDRLMAVDYDPMEYLGFVIFFRLGLTLSGFHDDDVSQKAITLFIKERWDSRRSKMTRFEYPLLNESH